MENIMIAPFWYTIANLHLSQYTYEPTTAFICDAKVDTGGLWITSVGHQPSLDMPDISAIILKHYTSSGNEGC